MKTDWFKIITDLQKKGLSMVQIGKKVGRNASTITRYRNGTQPSYETGEAILTLHRSLSGK